MSTYVCHCQSSSCVYFFVARREHRGPMQARLPRTRDFCRSGGESGDVYSSIKLQHPGLGSPEYLLVRTRPLLLLVSNHHRVTAAAGITNARSEMSN